MRIAAGLMLLAVNLQILFSLVKLRREPAYGEPGTVILTKKFLYYGLALALVAEAPAVIMLIMDVHPKAVLNFSILSLFGAILMRCYTSIRIYYDADGFRKFYFPGYSRYFRYAELTGIKGNGGDIKFYAGKRAIRVSVLADRLNFLYIAKRKYRHTHDRKDIPQLKGFDLFRGNLVKPGAHSVVLIIIMLVPLIFTLLPVTDYLTEKPIPLEELELAGGRVCNVEEEHGELFFSLENRDEHFRIHPHRSILFENPHSLAVSLCELRFPFSP